MATYGFDENKDKVEVLPMSNIKRVFFSRVFPVGVSTFVEEIDMTDWASDDTDWILDNIVCIGCGQGTNLCPSGELPTTSDQSFETLTRIKVLNVKIEYDYELNSYVAGITVHNSNSEPFAVNNGWIAIMKVKSDNEG